MEKEYCVVNNNNEKATIVTSKIENGERDYKVSFTDYDKIVISPIAQDIIAKQEKVSKKDTKNYFAEELKSRKGTIELSNNEILDLYLERCFGFKFSTEYESIINKICLELVDVLHKYPEMKVDFRKMIINHPMYRNMVEQLKMIKYDLLVEYADSDNEIDDRKINMAINEVDAKTNLLINDIQKNIMETINNDKTYNKNKKRIKKGFIKAIDENLLELINYDNCMISLKELIGVLPFEILDEALKDMNSKFTPTLTKIYVVVDKICRDRNGKKYSLDTINNYILRNYNKCLEGYIDYESDIETIKEPMDIRGKKPKYSYEPYYNNNEIEDYGDDTEYSTSIMSSRIKLK